MNCPYKALEIYFKKIQDTNTDAFFPRPRTEPKGNEWYFKNQVLGKDSLGGIMKAISTQLELSIMYTNHSVRATYITQLKDQGFSNEEICNVTGHKNPRSVDRYDRRKRERTVEKMTVSLVPSNKKPCTSSVNNTQQIVHSSIISNEVLNVNAQKPPQFFENCSFTNCSFNINQQ